MVMPSGEKIDSCENVAETVPLQDHPIIAASPQLFNGLLVVREMFLLPRSIEPVYQCDLVVLNLDRGDTPLPDGAARVEKAWHQEIGVVETAPRSVFYTLLINGLQLKPIKLDVSFDAFFLSVTGVDERAAELFDLELGGIDFSRGTRRAVGGCVL